MKTTNPTAAKTAWLRNLPEAGTIRDIVTEEERLTAEHVEMSKRLAGIKASIRRVRARAEKEALECGYTAAQIAAAKVAKW